MTYNFAKIGFALFATVLAATPAVACEPCMQVLTLDETIQKADIVMVAESDVVEFTKPEGPKKIQAKVLKVLKGNYAGETITLNSWYGMCPYGFIFKKPQEVLFITKNANGDYERVASGCDTNSLPYENGLVDGKESIDEFVSKHLTGSVPPTPGK